MRSSRPENLSEHALEVACIAHVLCTIGNTRYGQKLDADRAALLGLYHDATESRYRRYADSGQISQP